MQPLRKTAQRWLVFPALGVGISAAGADPRGVKILRGHTDVVCALAWSPDGKRLASGTPNVEGAFRLWDPASGKQVGPTSSGWGCGLAWRPDGKQIALAGGAFAEGIMIYDRTGARQIGALGGQDVFSVGWSPDGKRLAVGQGNGGIWVSGPPTLMKSSISAFNYYSGADAQAVIAALAKSTRVKVGDRIFQAAWGPATVSP